eukprot:6034926-Pyramimonas_sp.AAC.1
MLRRSKQPVNIQVRRLSTKLQNENYKIERLTKASQSKKKSSAGFWKRSGLTLRSWELNAVRSRTRMASY